MYYNIGIVQLQTSSFCQGTSGGGRIVGSKLRRKKKPACNQLNKPAAGSAQKDVECGVIRRMKNIGKIC